MSALQSHRGLGPRECGRPGFTLVEALVVLAIVVTIIAFLFPATRSTREPARRTLCKNNLRSIGLALDAYHNRYQELPPTYTVDEHGKPLHSWRTLILPFVEQQSLYQKIDLSKPWDDPANAEAFKTVVPVYQCPSVKPESGMTTYLAVTGDNTGFRQAKSLKIGEITDGTGNTLAVVDVASKHAVHWMSPNDAGLDLLLGLSAKKDDLQHSGGYHALFLDGTVRFLSIDLQESTVRALVSATANDKVGEF